MQPVHKVIQEGTGQHYQPNSTCGKSHKEHQEMCEDDQRWKAQNEALEQDCKRKQPTLSSTFARTASYDPANPKVQHLNSLLVKMLCTEGMLFN